MLSLPEEMEQETKQEAALITVANGADAYLLYLLRLLHVFSMEDQR